MGWGLDKGIKWLWLHMNNEFKKMVDGLIHASKNDKELADGIRWLDGQAYKNKLTFYEMVFKVLYQFDQGKFKVCD